MSPEACLAWVMSHAGTTKDMRTNRHVFEWLADKAKTVAATKEEIDLCDLAKRSAEQQLENGVET